MNSLKIDVQSMRMFFWLQGGVSMPVCQGCKHAGLVREPLRRLADMTPGEQLYIRRHPNRRMFFPSDIARMEELDRRIAAGEIDQRGRRVSTTVVSELVQ